MVRTDEDHLLPRCHPKEGAAGLKKKSKILIRIFKNNNEKKFLMMSVSVTVYITGGGDFFQIENVIFYSINQMLAKFSCRDYFEIFLGLKVYFFITPVYQPDCRSDQRRRPQSFG